MKLKPMMMAPGSDSITSTSLKLMEKVVGSDQKQGKKNQQKNQWQKKSGHPSLLALKVWVP
jgi:hypothetical protein